MTIKLDKGVNIGGEDNSVSPLIKFFIDGKQVGKSSVIKKEWFAKMSRVQSYRSKRVNVAGPEFGCVQNGKTINKKNFFFK